MNTFLNIVAKDLYKRFGNDMSRVAVVFPNRRAGLFFNECLAHQTDKPVWAPAYLSVKDLFQSLSPLHLGDPIELVCRLYNIFAKISGSKELLDDFYFWGELLISDFDDVDKNLVDADKLFSNLKDLQEMADDLSFLSEEQEEAIHRFFKNFSIEKRTDMKEKFISLWNVLKPVYHQFREDLEQSGIAYEGMLYRDVIEHLDTKTLKYDHYVFVGFNVLNKVEHNFFKALLDGGKGLFYWDYDLYYTSKSGNEAGEFIKRNLKDFPQDLSPDLFNELSAPKTITYVSATTENAQARYLPQWIRKHVTADVNQKKSECAIVLCNESLLLPVLHSLPDDTGDVNITMGYPLLQTPVYSFVSALLDLQDGYDSERDRYTYKAVHTVLSHPYTRQLTADNAKNLDVAITKQNRFFPQPNELLKDEFLTLIFTPTEKTNEGFCKYLLNILKEIAVVYRKEKSSDDMYNQLYRESLFQTYTTINRIYSLVSSGLLQVNLPTLRRLLDRLLKASNIPFHGEPAIGLQVMGVLETRNLDFKHLIMLSLNEGQLPKAGADASFIPYNLRKAFGMTTIEHKNAVYAYYFYRVIQRAETITLLYNNSTDGANSREMSRFMLQLLVEYPHEINKRYIEARQQPMVTSKICIEKKQEVMERLINRFTQDEDYSGESKKILSPSALNNYLSCPLKFYFMYVAKLKPEDEVTTDIDGAMFGTIFHKTAENIYKELGNNLIVPEMIDSILKDPRKIQDEVDKSFKTEFFKQKEMSNVEYNGLQLINSHVICNYIKQLLRNDQRYAPFKIVSTEHQVSDPYKIVLNDGKSINISIGGIIDRIDEKEGTIRIVDYKTGGQPSIAKDVQSLFVPDDKRPGYILQTFVYASILSKEYPNNKMAPSLLYIHKAAKDDYSPVIKMGKAAVTDFSEYQEEFTQSLMGLLQEIFDDKKPFEQTELSNSCTYCDFKAICGK